MPDTDPQEQHPVMQTYESDLSRAMDTTDAAVVQDLLATARERESIEHEKTVRRRERGWYIAGAFILLILALGAGAYGVYYYTRLTVPAIPPVSVGIFPSTQPIVATDSSITAARTILFSLELPQNKPYLVPLVRNDNTPISVEEFFAFMQTRASEPLQGAFTLARLGVMHAKDGVTPFLIFFTPNQTTATKELLIAEPSLLQIVAPSLAIDLSKHDQEIGKEFESRYMYNLPVRTLSTVDPDTRVETILFYYAFATDQTVVIATDPTVLKAVYDTVIKQH